MVVFPERRGKLYHRLLRLCISFVIRFASALLKHYVRKLHLAWVKREEKHNLRDCFGRCKRQLIMVLFACLRYQRVSVLAFPADWNLTPMLYRCQPVRQIKILKIVAQRICCARLYIFKKAFVKRLRCRFQRIYSNPPRGAVWGARFCIFCRGSHLRDNIIFSLFNNDSRC